MDMNEGVGLYPTCTIYIAWSYWIVDTTPGFLVHPSTISLFLWILEMSWPQEGCLPLRLPAPAWSSFFSHFRLNMSVSGIIVTFELDPSWLCCLNPGWFHLFKCLLSHQTFHGLSTEFLRMWVWFLGSGGLGVSSSSSLFSCVILDLLFGLSLP